MLNLVGAIVGMMAVAINLVAITSALSGSLALRLSLAAIVGIWVGLASGLGSAGNLAFSPNQPIPLVGVLFAMPLLIVGALALRSPRVRSRLMAIPMPLLIGLNGLRLLGVLFLFLAAAGRLSGPFPYSAGLGDMITGAFAIPLALSVARSQKVPLSAIARWNVFGTLDLFAAVALGITSAAGSPLQLIHAGVGSEAMQHLPFCLVPTVLVPFYLISHAVIAAQLSVLRTQSGLLSERQHADRCGPAPASSQPNP
jgi:hypothetical protein